MEEKRERIPLWMTFRFLSNMPLLHVEASRVKKKNDVYYYLAIRSYILKLRSNPVIVSVTDMNKYVAGLLADAIQGDEVKVLTQHDDSVNVIELLSEKKLKSCARAPPNDFVQIARELLERAISESRKNNYLKSQEYSKRLRKILEEYNDRDENLLPTKPLLNWFSSLKSWLETRKSSGIRY